MKEGLTQLHGNIYFLNTWTFDKFQVHNSSVRKKVESKFSLEKEFCKSNGYLFCNLFYNFLQFLFHDQTYFSATVIHVQLLTFWVQETVSKKKKKKKIGRISLIDTYLLLTPYLLKYFTALLHHQKYNLRD